MDQRTLLIVLLALGAAFGLVLCSTAGGIPGAERQATERELASFAQAEASFRSGRDRFEQLAKEHAVAFSPASLAAHRAALEAAANSLAEAAPMAAEARGLLERDRSEDQLAISQARSGLADRRAAAEETLRRAMKEAEHRVAVLQNAPRFRREIAEAGAAIPASALQPIEAAVRRAGERWPAKKDELDARLATMQRTMQEGQAALQRSASAAGVLDAQAIDQLVDDHRSVLAARELATREASGERPFLRLIEQLDWSIDRILIDMEERRGGRDVYWHQIRDVRTRALDVPKDPKSAVEPAEVVSEEPLWIPVTSAVFEHHAKNLGMVIEHKPAGKFNHEMQSLISAPGYAYIATPEERSNRYGTWTQGSGGSFWTWYGQYALMQNLLQGPRHGPISTDHFQDYRRTRDAGQTWYGPKDISGRPTYGSEGSFGQSRYAGSRYMQSGGYSGFRARATAASQRSSTPSNPSRSSTRSFGSSSSRSGSRSGGGK